MSESTSHLTAAAQEALALPTDERIARIRRNRWIGYPRAVAILDRLDELLGLPKTHRMPNLLIVGDTNNGKTMVVTRFAKKHAAVLTRDGVGVSVPVVFVQAPPVPDENRFYAALLDAVCPTYSVSGQAATRQFQVLRMLRFVEVRMIIIDEIHHVLAGHTTRQRQFLNVLKYLGNELQVPIVALGLKDAVRAVQTDPQLANRFQPVGLPRWSMNVDYLMLLASFEKMIPLRECSDLASPALAERLLAMSGGTIGELAGLLSSAAIHAIHTERERIDHEVLTELGWLPPAERRKGIEKLA